MWRIFGDTSFFVALLNPKDELHPRAQKLRADLRPFHLITSEMVLAELLNYFGARGEALRQAATTLVEQLHKAGQSKPARATVVVQTPAQFSAALSTYRAHADKAWSLTDCASYLIMQAESITQVLTHDRHFEQMGFKALLRT